MKKTRKAFEEYLNECPPLSDDISGGWYMGGKLRRGKYGALLRKYDPIAFEVGYNEYIYNT